MRQDDFNAIVEAQLSNCRKILCEKADEYVTDNDRLSNFKTAAILQNTTPICALGGMLAKHIVALYDFMEKDEQSHERWDEKITDTINYCLLLKALLGERSQLRVGYCSGKLSINDLAKIFPNDFYPQKENVE